jgi:hypothetical protein
MWNEKLANTVISRLVLIGPDTRNWIADALIIISGCPLLTCSGLSSLIQLRHMKELELTNCPGASKELFDYLREHLPRCLVIE